MKKRKITPSLLLVGVTLMTISPFVAAADTATPYNSSSVCSVNEVQHIFGSRLPDASASDPGAGKYDKITVNAFTQKKLGDQYVTKIDGSVEAEVGSHYVTMTFKSENGKVLSSKKFTPGDKIENTFDDTITDEVVANVLITVNAHDDRQHVMAFYVLTDSEKPGPSNKKPVINASDKTLNLGDKFDPLTGVTAIDAEDGDLTSKIQVTSNNVNTNKLGSYQVAYSVTDSDENVTERTIKVVVQ